MRDVETLCAELGVASAEEVTLEQRDLAGGSGLDVGRQRASAAAKEDQEAGRHFARAGARFIVVTDGERIALECAGARQLKSP